MIWGHAVMTVSSINSQLYDIFNTSRRIDGDLKYGIRNGRSEYILIYCILTYSTEMKWSGLWEVHRKDQKIEHSRSIFFFSKILYFSRHLNSNVGWRWILFVPCDSCNPNPRIWLHHQDKNHNAIVIIYSSMCTKSYELTDTSMCGLHYI